MNNSAGAVLWFTGLSGAGKSTICGSLQNELMSAGYSVEWLDGDVLRKELPFELGFTREDRMKQIKVSAYIADLLSRNGVIVLASFITPYEEMRNYCRKRITAYHEIYVKCPLETCMRRDVKGLYKLALQGKINRFTGISDPFEEPGNADLTVNTGGQSLADCVKSVMAYVQAKGIK
ncbi:adenylyl-sulfate kinase [Paenibacillus tarimensis]